jgi:hypothetical protein
MIDSELDPIIERIAREARRPVAVDPDAKERLLASIRAEASGAEDERRAPSRHGLFMLTPARFAALAAGLVGVGIFLGSTFGLGRGNQEIGYPMDTVVQRPPASDTVVTFVLVAPSAARVSVVGDFNQWSAAATPMTRIGNSNAWSVTVPIAAGRHLYSFLAVGPDGERWIADPYAPAADDGFGRVNSIVFVGKGSSL